jgi:hypothetical protein
MDRKKLALVIILLLLAATVVYSFVRWPRQTSVAKLKFAPGMTMDRLRLAALPRREDKLRLDLLDMDRPRFSGYRRNIFMPIAPNPAKMPKLPLKHLKPVAPSPPPPPPPPPPPKTPAQIAMDQVGQFVFLGYLQKENRKTIFLTKDNQIFLMKKGDKVAGKYEVAAVSENMLTISVSPGGEQVVIPLIQNRPLKR